MAIAKRVSPCQKMGLVGYEVWQVLMRNRWEVFHAIQEKVKHRT